MKILSNVSAVVVLAALAVLTVYTLFRCKSGRIKGKDSALAGIWWITIFVGGFLLHFIAYFATGAKPLQTYPSFMLSVIANSFVSAICFFCFVFNYGAISVLADGNWLYLLSVIACFVAGSGWSLFMLQQLFFRGVINGVAVWWQKIIPRRSKTTRYVVVGCEKSARLFLDSLTSGKDAVPKRLITVITGEPRGGAVDARFKELVKNGYRVIADKAGEGALSAAGVKADKNITVVVLTESNEQNIEAAELLTEIIFKSVFKKSQYADRVNDADFRRLVIDAAAYKAIEREKKPQEYERNREQEEEKSKTLQPVKDYVEKAVGKIKLKVRVGYSFIERTEHFAFAQNAFGRLDFFNPYEMRAREFFIKHPVTEFLGGYIDAGKARLKGGFGGDGKIIAADGKPYNIVNIFVGYGNTNYQMLKWSVLTGQLLGCDYNAVVYDEKIKEDKPSVLQSMFKNQSSGLFPEGDERNEDEYLPSPAEKYNIEFIPANVLSDSFYKDITKRIKDADYTAVYIALGDDSKDIETACEIRQILREYDIPLKKVALYAKVRHNTALNSDLVINNVRNIDAHITTFGAEEEIYSRENIVGETVEEYAKKISNTRGLKWELLSETERDSNRQVAIHLRTKLQLMGLDLADADAAGAQALEKADYDKAYGTDNAKVAEIIEKRDKLRYLVRRSDVDETFTGDPDPVLDTPRNNLARLEHLRWDTFNLVMGWTKKPVKKIGAERVDINGTDNTGRKNEYSKQHACITTFEGLIRLRKLQAEKMCAQSHYDKFEDAEREADTISYDFTTMDELFKRLPEDKKIVKTDKSVL